MKLPKDVIAAGGLLLLLGGLWFGGRQFEWSRTVTWIVLGATAGVAIVTWLVMKLLAIKRALTIERALKSGGSPEASAAEGSMALAGMRDTFTKYLSALKTTPGGKGALATLPWYLVIGAPGSGKTTAIQESGLAFASMGHGLRSVRGIGGTRNCDWWFTDNAILLDTAGRYTTQPEDQSEWLGFLDLIKETRGRRALNGIVVVVAVSDLIKGDPGGIAAVVKPIRERIIEVCTRLKLVVPVYVVFSKADLVGGFKDFFATFSRTQRDQVWGSTFTPGSVKPNGAREAYQERIAELLGRLQATRLQAMGSGRRTPSQLAKACLFPSNLATLQQWLAEFVAELFQPMALSDQPYFRGFYFTSGIQVPRPGESADAAAGLPAAAASAPEPRPDVSFFFQPNMAAGANEVADDRRGLFLKDLFARIILPDLHLAAIPAALVRRARLWRAVLIYGSMVVTLLLLVRIIGGHFADSALAERARAAAVAVATARADHPTARQPQLAALEDLRRVLVDIAEAPGGTVRRLEDRAQAAYFPLIDRFLVMPAAERLRADLEAQRQQTTQEQSILDAFFDQFRAYKMLGGEIAPEKDLLERVLIDEKRWFSALVDADGALDPEVEVQARRHLAYLTAVMPTANGWQARLDKTLVERIESSLGGVLWVQQGYHDAIATLAREAGQLSRDDVVSGTHRELVTTQVVIPRVFTPDGWRGSFQPSLPEIAKAVQERFKEVNIERSRDEIIGRLRGLYGRDYNARWLRLVSDLRPTPFRDLAEASTRLRQFSGEDSPYRTLAKTLATYGAVDFGDPDVKAQLPVDATWLGDGLTAVADLQVAVDRFLTGTQAGNRSRDLIKLAEFAQAADKAIVTFRTAVAKTESEAVREACLNCLTNIVDATHGALIAEIGAEQDRLWSETVAIGWTELAPQYPFTPDARTEAPLVATAALFNPKSGSLWARIAAIEALRAVRWNGKELLPVAVDYDRLRTQAAFFRDACFADNSETFLMKFTITLERRTGVKDMTLAVGRASFSSEQRPDRTTTFTWTQAEGGGTKLSLNLVSDQWLTKDYPTPAWGLIRLLREGEPKALPDGGLEMNWSFSQADRTYGARGVLRMPALETLVSGDYFKAFTVPARVTR